MEDPNRMDDYGFGGSMEIDSNLTCTRDIVVGGTLRISADVNLNGHLLAANIMEVNSGELNMNGGTLRCHGNLDLYQDSRLIMDHSEDYLLIGGRFTYQCEQKSFMTAGSMELRNGFVDISSSGFRAGGKHGTILNPTHWPGGGNNKDYIYFTDQIEAEQGFHTLIVRRPLEEFEFNRPVSELCNDLIYDIQDYDLPEKVTGVRVESATIRGITLVWDPAPDPVKTVGYEVFRDNVYIGKSSQCLFRDIRLSPGTTYSYTVYAYDKSQNRSPSSDVLLAGTMEDKEAPEVPRNLMVKIRTGSSVTLTWDYAPDNVQTAGYVIYRNGKEITSQIEGFRYKDANAIKDGVNVYQVASVDVFGNVSKKSKPVSVNVAMPRILSVTPADGKRFSGDAVELKVRFQNVGYGVKNMVHIEREHPEGVWISLLQEPLAQEKYNDTEWYASYLWDVSDVEDDELTLRYTVTDEDGNTDRIAPIIPCTAELRGMGKRHTGS